jgi:short-subunit dehydrogenase
VRSAGGTDEVPRARAPVRSSRPWQRALVTGASRGLGEAIAEVLAGEGVALTLLARDAAALAAVASRLRGAHGVDVNEVVLDLEDTPALAAWIERERESLGRIDLVVNAAARADAAPFLDADAAPLKAALATNVLAPAALTRAVLPGMLARRSGNVLAVVTSGARNALPLFSSYAASKGALWAWAESLARELAGTGVTVTAFLPPHMDTATRRQLGRRALGYYHVAGAEDRTASPADVAAQALQAARSGSRVAAPASSRWAIALNAIAPSLVERALWPRWRGIAPPKEGE